MTSTANQNNTNLMMRDLADTGSTRSKSRVNMSGLLHLNAMTSASVSPCTDSTKGGATSTTGSMATTAIMDNTATANTSRLSQVGKDTFQLRTRANFGDYQYYVPPETKATPSSVPTSAPVTANRDPSHLNPVDEVEEEKKDNDDDSELIIPNPVDQRRLQLFEESSQVDQIPFDQVWNQEEFTLDKSSDEGSGINSHSLEHDDDDDDKPFDEPEPEEEALPENSLEVSGSSAFTAFSTNSSLPPPPPPLPASHKRLSSPLRRNKATEHKLNVEFPASRTSPVLSGVSSVDLNSHSKSLECDDNNDDDNDDDIPSDEDESKKSIPTSDQGREKRNLSLATASQRTTAEDLGQRTVAENLSNSNLHDSDDDDDEADDDDDDDDDKSQDSLFDFKEKRLTSGSTTKARAPSPSPDQWAGPDPPEQNSEDEEASCDDGSKDGALPGLKNRSREAFASRRRLKNSSQSFSPTQERSASPHRSSSPPAARSTTTTKHRKNQVSFGATDTIHHFENEYDMNSESAVSYATDDNGKTLGSDVEEAIRDIFMINALESCSDSPRRRSRRKLRYQRPQREERRDLEPSEDNSDEDETTCHSEDENVAEASPKSRATSRISITDRSKREEAADLSNDEDVFFETMLSMVEGGLGVMSAAFGFAPAAAEEEEEEGEEIPLVCSPPVASPPVALPRQEKKSPPRRFDSYDSGTVGSFEGTIEGDLLDSMSDFIMGPEKSASSETMELDAPDDELTDCEESLQIVVDEPEEPQSLENDPRLLEMAKQSALCMHEMLGVRYDESREVDIEDVKFVVVQMALPLGIIFQEDYSGCWITKVLPRGNGQKSGKVEPGDQLAAINGITAIGMKVDDICDAITDAASKAEVELTFLRYIGPFLPLAIEGGMPTSFVIHKGADDENQSSGTESTPSDQASYLEEKPRSTMSITSSIGKKLSKKGSSGSSKRGGGIIKKLKWFGRHKKKSSKAE